MQDWSPLHVVQMVRRFARKVARYVFTRVRADTNEVGAFDIIAGEYTRTGIREIVDR